MEEIDKEISEMKISLNARARIVAEEFLKNVRNVQFFEQIFNNIFFISLVLRIISVSVAE